jgi:hypothetical protein
MVGSIRVIECKDILGKSMIDINKEVIGEAITSILTRSEAELLALTTEQLQEQWYFRWDNGASVEWNLYKFNDALAMFKRRCRTWEEHHNGPSCVVERVREKYLMPHIREIVSLLRGYFDDGGGQ